MTGLCGWIGGALAPAQGGQALSAMTRALGDGVAPSNRIGAELAEGAALAVAQGTEAGDLAVQGGVIAAVVGEPDWFEAADAARSAAEGPARALIAAYARHGNAVPTVVDEIAFAILDTSRRRAIVAIDRMGRHPMCFATAPDGALVFASSATGVNAYPGMPQDLDVQALYDMVAFSRVSAPLSIFRGQAKLMQAESLCFDDGTIGRTRYWHMPYDQPPERDLEGLGEELVRLTEAAVARAMDGIAPEKLGAFLSGGLDSSTVVGMLSRRTAGNAQAFTIGFAVEGYDEIDYARKAARHFGAKLHERYLTPSDVTELLPRIVAAYDEPYGNSSAVPALVCAMAASKEGVVRMLAGDGGDELFAGNSRYAFQKLLGLYDVIPGWLRRGVVEPIVNGFPMGERIMPVRRSRGYIRRARMAMPDRMESFNAVLWRDPSEIFVPELAAKIDRTRPIEHLRDVYEGTVSASMLHRMLQLDHQVTLADDDLRKVGRTCEMAGVQVRYPLLDRRVAALSARVPPSALLKGFRLRHFYKRAFRRFLPESTLTKSKHGFGNPVGPWLREYQPLQALAHDALASLRRRGLFNESFIDEVVRGHRDVHASYFGDMVWTLMVLSLWLDARRV